MIKSKISIKKRGVHSSKRKGFYFKGNRILLNSLMSKVAFFGILFLFGVVIVFGIFGAVNRERERLDSAQMK